MVLDRFIELIAPGLALRRMQRRIYLEHAKRLYDAAQNSNYHKRPKTSRSADGTMEHARGRLRDWARHLDENHDLAIGILDALVNNIVGTGIVVEPMVRTRGGGLNDKVNRQIRELWKDWTRRPEVTAELPFSEVQRLVCRSWLRDGEVLTRHIAGRSQIDHITRVPYSIQLIEADYLPFIVNDQNPIIVHGVEKDRWNRPTAYHLAKEHPGNTSWPFSDISMQVETIRVPAEEITHLKWVRRIGQTRGVSVFHGVLHRLDDIKDYEESERIAARVAAAFTGFIRKSEDFTQGVDADASDRSFEMMPGMIFDNLLPGEDVGTIASNRPNSGLQDFRNSQLRAIAAGTGASYSSISRDYNGTYSSQRQELVEAYPAYNRMRLCFIEVFLRPVYEKFIEMATVSGALKVPSTVIDADSLLDVDMRGPGMPWIDPKKEIEADAMAVQSHFKSRHQVIRERGGDPAIVDEQIKADPMPAQEPTTAAPQPDTDTEEP